MNKLKYVLAAISIVLVIIVIVLKNSRHNGKEGQAIESIKP
ncbi:hypothetical protein ACVWYN_002502 [Pedobacter sp. UYP24]